MRDLFEGRAAQTLIPSPTGGVEAIVWVMALERSYRIIAEPAERAAVGQALTESTGQCNAELRDIGDEQFALALIGPEAERVARSALGDEVESIALLNVLPMGRPPVVAARLVHFGERELHLFGAAGGKQALVERLERAAGEDLPRVGNDTLAAMMAESGYLSRARDIPHDASVFEAGLEWMVELRKLDLRAAEALERAKGTPKRKCVMMTIDGDAAGTARPAGPARRRGDRTHPVGVPLRSPGVHRRGDLPHRKPRGARARVHRRSARTHRPEGVRAGADQRHRRRHAVLTGKATATRA